MGGAFRLISQDIGTLIFLGSGLFPGGSFFYPDTHGYPGLLLICVSSLFPYPRILAWRPLLPVGDMARSPESSLVRFSKFRVESRLV